MQKAEPNKFEFEKKWLDKGPFTPWFNSRYWLLQRLGLNGYSLLMFVMGVIITLVFSQF